MSTSLPKLKRIGRGGRRGRGGRSLPSVQEQKTTEIFSHFTLNKDPEASKYMPYNEMTYPSMMAILDDPNATSTHAAESMESMWFSGHLDYERRTEAKRVAASMRPFVGLPGTSRMLPGAVAERRRLEKKRRKAEHADSAGRSSLSDKEEMRLKELAKEFGQSKTENVYSRTNKQIRCAVLQRQPRRMEPSLRAEVVTTMALRYRKEAVASTVLCRYWRRYYRKQLLLARVMQERYVVFIQALARSYIARRFVALWFFNSEILAVAWQSRLRRALEMVRYAIRMQPVLKAHAVVNRCLRGYLCRRRVRSRKIYRSALLFQKLWRGARSRCQTDVLWLSRLVSSKMQRRVRGVLGRMRFAALKALHSQKALFIQRCWRGWDARRQRNTEIYDRETRLISSLTRYFASEGQRLREEAKKMKILNIKTAQEKVEQLVLKVRSTEESYNDRVDEHARCTPRSVANGFKTSLEEEISMKRKQLTREKSELIFIALRELRSAEDAAATRQKELELTLKAADRAEEDRECEITRARERESRTFHAKSARAKRQTVGDQRRKWAVKFFNPQGKPQRAPQEAAVKGHDVFCGGTVDLFADISPVKHRLGSEEAVKAIDAKLRLQSWKNQVAQIDGLFKPLHASLQRMQDSAVDAEPTGEGFTEVARCGAQGHIRQPQSSSRELAAVDESTELSYESNEFFEEAVLPKQEPAPWLDAVIDYDAPSPKPTASGFDPAPFQRRRHRPAEKPKKKNNRRRTRAATTTSIPWSLLDELEAEKLRFREQVAMDSSFLSSSCDHAK